MAVPPFETFYVEHRDVVLGFLRRRLGGQAAEDAFQETFLRALRAYDRLDHGEHLRAWVLTIAARLVIDTGRQAKPVTNELPELPVEDGRPAYAQIEHLAGGLPPTERDTCEATTPCRRSLKTTDSRPLFGWARRHSHRQMPQWDVSQYLSVP